MKIAFLPRLLCLLGLTLASTAALAAPPYDFSGTVGDSTFPTCSGGTWSASGSTYTCTGSISLVVGDSIVGSKNITVVASAGINLAGNNTIGSASKTVDLQTASGDISASNSAGVSSSFYGNLTSGSGSFYLTNAIVYGSLTTDDEISLTGGSVSGNVSGRNGVKTTNGTVIGGNVVAGAGSISLSGGKVSGSVSSGCCTVTTYYTDIGSSVSTSAVGSSSSTVSITGGTIVGSITTTGGLGISIKSATVNASSISAGGNPIKISDSTVTVSGAISGGGNDGVTMTNSTVAASTISAGTNPVKISGSTVSGAISGGGSGGVEISGSKIPSGSVTATNAPIKISDSTIGSPSSSVNVSGNNVDYLFDHTTVYGNVTAGGWNGALNIDDTSSVYGNCTPSNSRCNQPLPGPHHIQLELSGSPLTCAPSTVTVKACTSAAPGCTPLYTATATAVTLSASNGAFWSASPVTFTGSTTVALRKTTVGSTTLIATSSGGGATACYLNSSANNCQVDFADSALLLTIPLQTAGVTSSGASLMTVSAVRASNSGKECVAAFGGQTRNVKFWSSYDDPSTGTKTLAVKGTSIPMSATSLAASTPSTGTAVALTFNATGTASVPLKYDDAGRLLLKARYDGNAANSDVNLVMTGSSLFVTAPYGLCVDSSDQNPDGTAAWLCAAADPASCSKYRKAGEAFAFRVSGKAYQSEKSLCAMPTTANYQQKKIALSAKVVAPSDGDNGALGTQTIDITANGTATISKQTHSEVGVFTFTATPPASAYFGQTVAPGTSANFGRFIPDHFAITSGAVAPACGGFSYFGQDGFTTSFTLTAQNFSSGTTTNYRGDFAKLPLAAWNAYGFATAAALPVGSALTASSTPPSGNWVKGVAAVSAKHQISRPSALAGETSVKLTARPVDSDGVTMASAAQVQSAATPLRFGRLRLISGQGSGQAPYVVKSEAQYWDGSYWRINAQDSCTSYATTNAKVTGNTGTTVAAASGVSGGYGSLTLSKPTSLGLAAVCLDTGTLTNDGCIAASPASIGYLRGNWKVATVFDQDPSATVLFGGANADSRGNWGFLYRRENF